MQEQKLMDGGSCGAESRPGEGQLEVIILAPHYLSSTDTASFMTRIAAFMLEK